MAALYIFQKKGAFYMKRERFEQRLLRIFAEAGYSPLRMLTLTPEEMVEVPGVTVPNIRAVLYIQNKVLKNYNNPRAGKRLEALLSAKKEEENE